MRKGTVGGGEELTPGGNGGILDTLRNRMQPAASLCRE